ncbi:hypothetical protein [Mesorhizobium sp.]|uniref:hypothetical protein n=1 Tax=Mesorhizobium sp. TaxID=1871066 RepID=UPI000FEA2837|nr:hypothetical protein [Mesorhizobium sp.]RWQ47500.1 MAG: hypothetical protein EOS84_28480 [Mesorhizobium sp.]
MLAINDPLLSIIAASENGPVSIPGPSAVNDEVFVPDALRAYASKRNGVLVWSSRVHDRVGKFGDLSPAGLETSWFW